MATILHLDSSARAGGSEQTPHGSHTRRLSSRFVAGWRAARPGDTVVYRDVGQAPPSPVTGRWIHSAFTPPAKREPWMTDVLAESDALVDELLDADLIVAGVPMYNFNVPAQFKAYIDNIVRVGRTFGFDRSRAGDPYWPLLTEARKKLVILSSRGDFGYGRGERIEAMNHVEPSIRTAFGYMGITDVDSVAIEYDEFGGERLKHSIAQAEDQVDALVARLLREWAPRVMRPAVLGQLEARTLDVSSPS
ncbi:NAD(P)H-dependent oxidoreductase [Corallococcus sp. M34]|uniref:FMN-dependent NADH-azoreductase n=1 Tax=Citreicoccus inhibens TaxID=2849499 RepID=UPI001C242EB7|nr:NAD(P)H-dependent oxidoreductase [Citreicoccus inhibens]MBU8897796.1 NAD(P)H-dependent oxidoreductase [Citreicoccus inhibens]